MTDDETRREVAKWSAARLSRVTHSPEKRPELPWRDGILAQRGLCIRPLTFDLRVITGSTLSTFYLVALASFSVIRVPRLLKYSWSFFASKAGLETQGGWKIKGGRKRHFLNQSNGHLGPYNLHRKLKDTKTVSEWKKERFEPIYPGYGCEVLLGNGNKAIGHTILKTVRSSYASPPP